jgi:DNA-binding SARP family transcriptional activator/Tfp pilus assembly protein PilF
MEFRLLGPIEATVDGRRVELSRRRERGVLALLLLEVGQSVATERLIELLWADDPPADPRRAVQVSVSRLRRWLATVDRSHDDVRVDTVASGYAIHADPMSVDVHRFAALVAETRRYDDAEERARVLREALALWRGTPLADLGSARLCQAVRQRLEELRLDALERRVEADIECGRHLEVISELADLTARYPTRENLVAARMTALARAGRKQDALAVYRETADRLIVELGLDPGQDLRDLHTQILRDDVDVASPTPRIASSPIRPAQLPADLPVFTGRARELAGLLELGPTAQPPSGVISIDGMAGVGKTALAVHAAHRLAPEYPDGALYVDLHGFTEGVDPVRPGDALDRMLRSLGVPSGQIPAATDERAALFRSVLADRRVLILLDNASTEAQVQPLLPAANSLALITSRHRLVGLDLTHSISLESLRPDEAITLFTSVAGADRLSGEPSDLVEQVVELCGRLPLAIRLVGARLRGRTAWSIAFLLDRLGDEHRRLAEMEAGERSVAGALDLSYQHLTPDQQHLIRRLGLHPGLDFDPYAAATLADITPQEAEAILDELLEAHVLQQDRPERYRFHDLVRTHVATRVATDEPGPDRDQAVRRLLDWYLHTVDAAMRQVEPHRPRPSRAAAPTSEVPAMTDHEQAMAWLEGERVNLMAAVQLASVRRWHAYARDLPLAMHRYFYVRGYRDDWIASHQLALKATWELADPSGEAEVLNNLGIAQGRIGRYPEAVGYLDDALTLRRQVGDRHGAATALNNLGIASWHAGRSAEALDTLAEALALRRELDDLPGQANVLNNLGTLYEHMGRYADALEHLQWALERRRALSDRRGEASTLDSLGVLFIALGSHQRAETCLARALALHRETGHRDGEADTLNGLGRLYTRLGRHGTARDHHVRALTLGRRVDNSRIEAEALIGIGELCHDLGDHAEALRHHRVALALVEHAGSPFHQARARHGIGRALLGAGESDAARGHLAAARQLFRTLGAPEADEIEAELTSAVGP